MMKRMILASMIAAFPVSANGTIAQEYSALPVEGHGFRNQMKLGFQYILSPRMASSAEVFRVYGSEDVRKFIWGDGSGPSGTVEGLGLVFSSSPSRNGVIIEGPEIGDEFETIHEFGEFENCLAGRGISVRVASREALPTKSEYMVIYREGNTPESVGLESNIAAFSTDIAGNPNPNSDLDVCWIREQGGE